jgi:cell division protein FtsQ
MSRVSGPRHVGGNALAKLLAWTLAAGVVVLPLVGALNGWFAADRWPFRQLKVDARFERVSAEQVRAAVAPALNGGFFAVDLAAVRRGVESVPWVERAEVRRRWPDVLEVRVVERVVAAAWTEGRLVDAAGGLFTVPGDTVPEGLPQLSGPDSRAADALAFHREIVEAMRGTGMAPQSLALSPRGSWTLRTTAGVELVLGREQPGARLRRFLDALRQADPAAGLVLVRADLRYANGFAVEWQQRETPDADASPSPAATPTDTPPQA